MPSLVSFPFVCLSISGALIFYFILLHFIIFVPITENPVYVPMKDRKRIDLNVRDVGRNWGGKMEEEP